jgi:hypothetical protein
MKERSDLKLEQSVGVDSYRYGRPNHARAHGLFRCSAPYAGAQRAHIRGSLDLHETRRLADRLEWLAHGELDPNNRRFYRKRRLLFSKALWMRQAGQLPQPAALLVKASEIITSTSIRCEKR